MTRSISNRFGANCIDTNPRYRTMIGSVKIQKNSMDSAEFVR